MKKKNLQDGGAVDGGDGDEVVAEGVGDVLTPVGGGALRGDGTLDEHAEHGDHGEATVLDLLHLEVESFAPLKKKKKMHLV